MRCTACVLVPVLCLLCQLLWRHLANAKCTGRRFGDQCTLKCKCVNHTECDDVTGRCAAGCSPGWSGTACQRENIAFALPSLLMISDFMTEDIGKIATDGDIRTCSSSRPNRYGRWKIDLKSTQRIYSMKIHTGNTTFRSWKVYISNDEEPFWSTPCTTLRYDGTETYFTCDKPVHGRYVGIMNTGPITICELEIFTCANYTYGVEDCGSRCRCSDRLEVCDQVYGTCKSGCQEGWSGPNCDKGCNHTYGKNCVHRCGRCHNGTACNVITGRCMQGCAPGWKGVMCEDSCSLGSYGINCTGKCAHCVDGTTCATDNGTCAKGCADGWKGPRCDTECESGEYGKNCALHCGHCKNRTGCDRISGQCPGGCDSGWEGRFCNQECLPGKFGEDCQLTCGHCLTYPCNRHNGSCGEDGCQEGWSEDWCDFACEPGFFGSNCDMMCGHCNYNVTCDPLSGSCGTNCTSGYYGDKCILTCPDGSWGDNCSNTCGLCHKNRGCNPVTGLCDEGCFVGYYGTYCTSKREFEDLSSAIVMPVMAVSVSIVAFNLCLLFVCLIFKWRRDERYIPHAGGLAKEALLPPQPEISRRKLERSSSC